MIYVHISTNITYSCNKDEAFFASFVIEIALATMTGFGSSRTW